MKTTNLTQLRAAAQDTQAYLSALTIEKDALNARLRIIRREQKTAKDLALSAQSDYTRATIENTKNGLGHFNSSL